MPRLSLLIAAALLAAATSASATSLVVTTDAVGRATVGSSDATSDASSSDDDDKLVREARDDAASFVASQGEIRGARLEAALQHIRHQTPQLEASDMQLAEAILAH
ncbi:DUF2388 domain-containing protein [Azotobacter chroococcum]|uniref:Holliday junction resolvasome, helicase subunit n=1 Tax=Azotobacter chroococcum NCIMB 8003 TaxID=1328314 RepID=A0A0C4WKX6_9GAMM|nr:DUF2388 domain-containing protein [Azotobacter chroococcum]AJE19685.1 Hypothetical protein Achr_1710 [Azotobacter chroococcum NCIMB 8003]